MITSNTGVVVKLNVEDVCWIPCCSIISSAIIFAWVYPEPFAVTATLVINPPEAPPLPPIVTVHNPPVPSPRIGTL